MSLDLDAIEIRYTGLIVLGLAMICLPLQKSSCLDRMKSWG